jgi:hypothetical protein
MLNKYATAMAEMILMELDKKALSIDIFALSLAAHFKRTFI